MLRKYVIHNLRDNLDVGIMEFDHDRERGTVHFTDVEHSCFLVKLQHPSGSLNEEETDAFIKERVVPPYRQDVGSCMRDATGKSGCAYNPYTLFFHNKGRHSSDYLEWREVRESQTAGCK